MKFYIDNGIITTSDVELNLQELTAEQVEFYLANRDLSISEILAMKKRVTTIDEEKQIKLGELESNASQLVSLGYTDADLNIKIAINESDVLAFNNLLTLLNVSEKLGVVVGEQTITDYDGKPTQLSYINLQMLLLKMGAYLQSIWTNLATKKAMVKVATTKTAVRSVTW